MGDGDGQGFREGFHHGPGGFEHIGGWLPGLIALLLIAAIIYFLYRFLSKRYAIVKKQPIQKEVTEQVETTETSQATVVEEATEPAHTEDQSNDAEGMVSEDLPREKQKDNE
jgi:hypothetical protein